ncbi:MAG: S41 family peptidase [Clostridia bacterium]|nr:S41 family peptidase [Clostridia bacterium]
MKLGKRGVLYVTAIVLIAAMLSATATILITNASRRNEVILTAEAYNELLEANVVTEIIDRITDSYLGEVPDRDTLFSAAANGMLQAIGDAYAQYYTKEEYEDYLEGLSGEYSGLGILISQPDENGVRVLDVYEGNPGMAAGILIGDYIVAIDGVSVFDMTYEEIVTALDGEAGTSVALTLARTVDGESTTLDVTATRDIVTVRRVHYALYNQATGYIRIDMFTQNSVSEFEEAIRNLTERGMKSLVIDLRNNPGGNLDAVVDIADVILPRCDIVSVRGTTAVESRTYSSDAASVDLPIAVIVNENSASASELFAAAIQENDAGIVVGMQTYGKGVVQTFLSIESSQGWLKLTTDEYFTPNGNNLDGVGVTPDTVVDIPAALKGLSMAVIAADYQAEDTQLWAALDYVREMAQQMS